MTGHVERTGVSLQFRNQVRLFAERSYHGERQGRNGMDWRQQQIDRFEQGGDPAAQRQPPQQDVLVVDTG